MATTAVTIKPTPELTEEQQAANGGFTHLWKINADNLNETTANTSQTIALGTILAGNIINKTMIRLIKPFKDVSDPTFNSNTLIVGDAGSSNRYVTSAQLNENGTEITIPQYNGTAYQVTADTPLLAVVASMSGKSLSNIDVGEVHILMQIIDTRILSELQGTAQVTTK